MDYDSRQRLRAVVIAQSILDGELDVLEGVRKLNQFSGYIDADNPARSNLITIEVAIDDLLIGIDRSLWSAEFLTRMDAQIDRARKLHRESILQICEEVIRLFR